MDDLIRWSDGSIWARQLPSGATGATSSGADLGSLGGFAWKAAARRKAGRLAPELAELFSPGPDIASAEWEDTAAQVAGTRREGRAEGSEQRLWLHHGCRMASKECDEEMLPKRPNRLLRL